MATATSTKNRIEKNVKERIDSAPDAQSIARRFTTGLDDIQSNLPRIPAKWMELNRAVAGRTFSTNRRNIEMLLDSVQVVTKTSDNGVRTVVGTVRSSVGQTVDAAVTGLRTIRGQASAQARLAADSVDASVTDITDEIADRLDATISSTKAADTKDEKRHLRAKTKDELYEQAQLLDIEGRGDMNKSQLVDAITKAL